MLGRSRCEVSSCVDLKDAFHSLSFTDKAKEFRGILPYFGSSHYRYEVLPMGLSISTQVWITYIENLLKGTPNRQSTIAIMDDLMLHGLKSDYMVLFEQLLVTLIAHGLKLSPRKCQLFMKHLVYLGNVFHIENGIITITPMKSRIEAIQKLPSPTTVKGCKSFCGDVTYLSLFCKYLHKILKPIYELTRKAMPFHWSETHQAAFEQIKELLIKPPILHLPRPGGRFILYCDTSKTHTGSCLWHIQDGKPRLLGYASKSLPEACDNYSVTELEITGLAINIHLWKHLLLRVEFDCAVDHSALPYIVKSKNLPATGRIVRLLEHLSGYSFKLYFVKGKDMILCDYLSRIDVDRGDPSEVIPISFKALVQYRLALDYSTECFMITHFMVATRSGTSAAGINLPQVHGAQKAIDPTLKPESQSKTQEILAKLTPITPGRKVIAPSVKWTPAQATPKPKLKSPSFSTNTAPRTLLNTPMPNQTPIRTNTSLSTPGTQQRNHQQTPVRGKPISKSPISPAHIASRKLIQKSVKILNTPTHRPVFRPCPEVTPNAKALPSTDTYIPQPEQGLEISQLKLPIGPMPNLSARQVSLPQENPFDINSELIPTKKKRWKLYLKPQN